MRSKIAILLIFLFTVHTLSHAQEPPSATPAIIIIPSATPPATAAPDVIPTFTPSSTPADIVVLEAISEVNVRSGPDLDYDRIGTIRPGDVYPVLGRAFRWLQFQYEPSPNRTGWVYDELVTITGDSSKIPDLNANILPTLDTSTLNITQTWEAINQVPGGLLTATALARVIQVPSQGNTLESQPLNPNSDIILPTFTYPPDLVAQAPDSIVQSTSTPMASTISDAVSGGIAPIVPILILGGLGSLGLLITSMRR